MIRRIRAIRVDLDQSGDEEDAIDRAIGVIFKPADEISTTEWLEERGQSLELNEMYRSYDLETLLKLADEGDIYALQRAFLKP